MALAVLSLPLALVAFVVALSRRHVVTVRVNEHAEVVRIARHTRGWRVAGLLLGLVAAGLALGAGQSVDALGRLVALAPTLLGVGVLLGTIAGELTARPRVGVRRTAMVETRTVRGILPRVRTTAVVVAAALLAGALALGAAWGGPDDMGRAGRSFTQQCRAMVDGALVEASSSRGPWPGSFYAVPMAAALALAALLVVAALVAVTRRPRPEPESLGLDSMLRRWSAGSILTAALFTVLGTLGPVALLLAEGLQPDACPMSLSQSVVRWVALVVGPVAVVAGAVALGALVVTRTIRVDDLPRALPGGATPVGAPVR